MNGKRLVVLAATLAPLAACDWFTDFKRQPKIDPWEAYTYDSAGPRFRGQPTGSVPTFGSFAPGYAVSYNATPGVIDSLATIPNPTAPGDSSIANGRKYYEINCAVCHGVTGAGDGPATKYGMVPISLLTPVTQNRTDGYIFGMIRNGRGLMPPYNRIEEMDRWDVVNYVRGLQGKLGRPVPTGPVGAPGETGDKLPGATRIGPNHPAPWRPATASTQTTTPHDSAGASGAAPGAAPHDTAGARRNPGAQP